MRTKKMVQAQLRLLENLASITKKLECEIRSNIFEYADAVEELHAVAEGKHTADNAFGKLMQLHALDKIDEGKDVILPKINLYDSGRIIFLQRERKSIYTL